MRRDDYISDEHQAELEDRAAELVDRVHLLGQERADWEQGRAEQHAHDCAGLTERANRWEAIKARAGHPCDYGERPWWQT